MEPTQVKLVAGLMFMGLIFFAMAVARTYYAIRTANKISQLLDVAYKNSVGLPVNGDKVKITQIKDPKAEKRKKEIAARRAQLEEMQKELDAEESTIE